jgi:hypothetical protein
LNERYLFAGIPFLSLLVVAAVTARAKTPVLGRREPALIGALAAACTVLGSWLWLSRSPLGEEHAIATMNRSQAELRASFEQGVPIVNLERKRHATGAALGLFLSQEQSKRARVAYPKEAKKGGKSRCA